MFLEIFNIIVILTAVFFFSLAMNDFILDWQSKPLKEEKSIPIYITKEIKED